MSPTAQSVIQRLDGARQKWWIFTLLSTAILGTATSFGVLLLFMLTDSFVRFSQTGLAILFSLWLAATITLVVLVGRRLVRSQRSLEAAARRIEAELPQLGSDLINIIQLAEDTKIVDRAFCDAAVRQAAARLQHVHFDEAATKENRWRRFLYGMQTPRDLVESVGLLALLIGGAMACQLLVPNWGSAANRLMKPWDFVPSVGKVAIVGVQPGDTEVLIGSSLDITAEIKNPKGDAFEGKIFIAPEGEPESPQVMAPDETSVLYKVTLPAITKPLKYRVEIGDSQSKVYAVQIREKPTINEVDVKFHYPDYLGRADDSLTLKDADLNAPQYTVAELRIHPSVAVSEGYIELDGRKLSGRIEDGGQAVVIEEVPLLRDGSYMVHLVNSAGNSDPNPRLNRITVIPDQPPGVELIKPARKESAAPGAGVPVLIRATDDYAVGHVWLEMKIKKAAEGAAGDKSDAKSEGENQDGKQLGTEIMPLTKVQDWQKFEGTTNVTLNHRLDLPADKVQPGCVVMVRAVAQDKRVFQKFGLDLKPQEKASDWNTITIVNPDAKAAAAMDQAKDLRGLIFTILEEQIRARAGTTSLTMKKEFADQLSGAGAVRTQQVDIQKKTIAAVGTIKDSDNDDRRQIKRVLNQLAFGEMLTAVQQCDEMVKQKAAEAIKAPVPKLAKAQERVIEVLRKVLDATRHAEKDALAEMKKRPGGELPDDTKKKLEEAKRRLDELTKQQKKILEATENLAKKPTEDFAEGEQEQLIKQMKALEDDWGKFQKDLHSDLSKLPEQDFANGSMAKEMSEIQTELKMAEDAMLKKADQIAVPLEQLGYERAESLNTNIEKWLPDTPKRDKWSQEEALTDADKEAPMAELPGELEDLIGDLMEEEEDVMDEAEDISSSAVDSADKGAGWDATDGPISDQGAKGVTGNRLPSASEIAGRSGEGRQGKSSGEFVGDEAVGKGGRNTPSRLTPDPIMKGQIKDHNRDNAGGATGGGKESGQGGEGLEGPTANSPGKRDLQRLAGKQAALRNKAEVVDAHFQVTQYHHTDLKKLIDTMSKMEIDLKAGNYQNFLRQRKVLAERAGNVKQYLEGEFQVKKDTTTNLPGEIQKEMLNGMQDPSPPGWEELNRQYFGRLSGGGAAAPAAPKADVGTAPKTDAGAKK